MPSKHTATQILGRPDPANVTISRVEYDSLLRLSKEYDMLKHALFQGGLTPETLGVLISGSEPQPQRQTRVDSWADDYNDNPSAFGIPHMLANGTGNHNGTSWKPGINHSNLQAALGAPNFTTRNGAQNNLRIPSSQRHPSNGIVPSSVPEDGGFEEGISSFGDGNTEYANGNHQADSAMRTLYFCGFHPRTTYRDLLSVIKGGKILSINLRAERSATVTFHDGAAEYLAWVKRNDIYLHGKRVEVRWAERQFRLNNHINNKVANGASRNLLIRNAADKGMTEDRIRDDMEHIHNLIIIDVTFQGRHAYVSTTSIHTALFARTCMMSRSAYRGCKVEFYQDECDTPLPFRAPVPRGVPQEPAKKPMSLANRFDMLDTNSDASSTDIENRDPLDGGTVDSDDDTTIDIKCRHGVRLDFVDSESEA
ncbi:hypothetical protein M409DRAFT_54435 [Zasmidium cellare ATCC 36951]|uniref:RRM domain-containing protein n=1 Tax=Zasmidium cellare ATCC 36951 TaxID=1080233 RepID=A0A6A6CKW4_ZASCE|nr:uncharacterized protein M409DRAFT_54435 [Zasmidium cellare ATCC 36951]KAF2167253.1 hypothetical protein M409DRAFT_54435 [Zasmidium cellare ATCC 36951]